MLPKAVYASLYFGTEEFVEDREPGLGLVMRAFCFYSPKSGRALAVTQ